MREVEIGTVYLHKPTGEVFYFESDILDDLFLRNMVRLRSKNYDERRDVGRFRFERDYEALEILGMRVVIDPTMRDGEMFLSSSGDRTTAQLGEDHG